MTTFGDRVFQNGGTPVGGDLLGLVGDGKVFYVDVTSGASGATGLTPSKALSTTQAAVDKCLTQRGDVIIQMPRAAAETLDTTVTLAVGGLTMIAATYGQGYSPTRFQYIASTTLGTSGSIFTVTRPMAIIGLEFATRTTSARGGAIYFQGDDVAVTGDDSTVRNCNFNGAFSGRGIHCESSEGMNIEGNYFDGQGNVTEHVLWRGNAGIVVPKKNVIRGNYFFNATDGLHLWGGNDFLIHDNYFIDVTNPLNLRDATSATNGLVANNRFDGLVPGLSISGGTDTMVGMESDTGFRFAGNAYRDENNDTPT